MRTLVSIGFVITLVSWSAGTVGASPPPFLLSQRAVSSTPGADGFNPFAGLIDVNGVLWSHP